MQPPKKSFLPSIISLAGVIVLILGVTALHAQTVAAAARILKREIAAAIPASASRGPARGHETIIPIAQKHAKDSATAASHKTVVCSTDGLCKTVVRPGPAPFHYVHHGCGMSALPSCRGGAYVKGVDF